MELIGFVDIIARFPKHQVNITQDSNNQCIEYTGGIVSSKDIDILF